MSIINHTTPYDHPGIVALREEINAERRAIDRIVREHNIHERELCDQYDTLLAAQRPTYPTREHLDAIDRIAIFVHHDLAYGDHHGNPRPEDREAGRVLPSSVKFYSTAQRINVHAGAPYKARTTSRAWKFTEDEIEALRQHIRSNKLRITREWTHEDGVAFIVTDARV